MPPHSYLSYDSSTATGKTSSSTSPPPDLTETSTDSSFSISSQNDHDDDYPNTLLLPLCCYVRGALLESPKLSMIQKPSLAIEKKKVKQNREKAPEMPVEKKAVAFADTLTVIEVENLRQTLNPKERSSVWYNNAESAEILRQCQKIVFKMNRDIVGVMDESSSNSSKTRGSSDSEGTLEQEQQTQEEDEEDDCTRGLEAMTRRGRFKLKKNRSAGVMSVLGQQELHVLQETEDPELLALVYYYSASRCKTEARMRAVQDEAQAKAFYA